MVRTAQPAVRFLPRLIEFLGYCPYEPGLPHGRRLGAIREALGLTRLDVARRMAVDGSVVSRWGRARAGCRSRTVASYSG